MIAIETLAEFVTKNEIGASFECSHLRPDGKRTYHGRIVNLISGNHHPLFITLNHNGTPTIEDALRQEAGRAKLVTMYDEDMTALLESICPPDELTRNIMHNLFYFAHFGLRHLLGHEAFEELMAML